MKPQRPGFQKYEAMDFDFFQTPNVPDQKSKFEV